MAKITVRLNSNPGEQTEVEVSGSLDDIAQAVASGLGVSGSVTIVEASGIPVAATTELFDGEVYVALVDGEAFKPAGRRRSVAVVRK